MQIALHKIVRMLKAACLVGMVAAFAPLTYAISLIDGDYKSATLSASNLVVLDSNNEIHTSADQGATFTLRQDISAIYGSDENFTELEAFGSTVVGVGIDGLILTSLNDGVTWTEAASFPTIAGSLYGLAAKADAPNPNQWIAVGGDGFLGVIISSTDNGDTWTTLETFNDMTLNDAIWTGNQWLVCGLDELGFEGIVYYSTDGTTWSPSTVPAGISPLLAMEADGAGVVIAVGESGQILRSTDDGETFTVLTTQYAGGGNFNDVVINSSGDFFVGGDQKRIVEINGTTAVTLIEGAVAANPIQDLILLSDEPVATGVFPPSAPRTIPFAVHISVGGSQDYVLSVQESLTDRSYYVETTTDLINGNWSMVPGSSIGGNGGPLTFDVSKNEDARFWRVIEF